MADSPYKFLDYYGIDDAESFFGRDRETEILLSDVISTPLVLLFAKTGSGKTSLINAGVRPRLEELGYRTFYVRVERDPTKSAREALRQARLLPRRVIRKSLDFQLADTVRRLKRPIVLFFDQFEEFFLYILNRSPDKARKFIANVAELYSNPDSGVHLVFSFREEFFIELDAFREDIPTIFHNDSNLRLRWLDETQARQAITGPAKMARFKIEEPLIKKLLSDLSENGRIEPARLQIICDTLWRERFRGQARLADYERLGGATRILDWRLGQDINKTLDDRQLEVLRKLIPHLANTERGTKYIRGLNELTESLGTTKEYLRRLIDKLKRLHLVRESTRYDEVYVEWTSDYLAERTQYLEERVHAIFLRRMLTNGIERAKSEKAKKRSTRTSEERLWALYLFPTEFEVISANEALLGKLSSAEVEFLFEASLEHGVKMDLWFQRAIEDPESRKNAWRILENKIANPQVRAEQAENAVTLLGAQRTGAAMKLLKKALQQEALASTTIAVLGEMRTKAAMEILQSAVEREDLADQIVSMLSGIRTFESVRVLSGLLSHERLSEDAERALERLSKVGVSKPSMFAKEILDRWREHSLRSARAESRSGSVAPARSRAEDFIGRSWGRSDWLSLLHRIRDGSCTPFVGPRLAKDAMSIYATLAAWLANNYVYTGGDRDISEVAQFLSVKYDRGFVTKLIAKTMGERQNAGDEVDAIYEALATLPISLYMTTNYDHILERALQRENKNPFSSRNAPAHALRSHRPRHPVELQSADARRPIVYHLYGDSSQPESLVLTEDDYLKFLSETGQDTTAFPNEILSRLARGSYLFVGYDQSDLGFRVLVQGIVARFIRMSSGGYVQLTPNSSEFTQSPKYAEQYFGAMGMKIYWGSSHQFAAELLKNWKSLSY
jgi:hypothetical protein